MKASSATWLSEALHLPDDDCLERDLLLFIDIEHRETEIEQYLCVRTRQRENGIEDKISRGICKVEKCLFHNYIFEGEKIYIYIYILCYMCIVKIERDRWLCLFY